MLSLTGHESRSDALASLQGGTGICVGGNGHPQPARDDRRDCTDQEGDGRERAVVQRGRMLDTLLVSVPLGGEPILGAQEDEYEDRETSLHARAIPRISYPTSLTPRSAHKQVAISLSC